MWRIMYCGIERSARPYTWYLEPIDKDGRDQDMIGKTQQEPAQYSLNSGQYNLLDVLSC